MIENGKLRRLIVGAIVGAMLGAVFGGLTALGAGHGDATIKSGLGTSQVLLLSFGGWTVSATVIAGLWPYARNERSAIWVGIISAIPFVLTHLFIATPRSQFFSAAGVFIFVIGDVIGGVVLGELAWKNFGPASGLPPSPSETR